MATVELGYLSLVITVWQGTDVVSVQPFNVWVYDDYMGGAGSFIELIQELQRQIENMALDMNNAIKLTEKGVPNGVATLDATGKIPLAQLPTEIDAYLKHTTETIYKGFVHGLNVDKDGMLVYKGANDNIQYVGFSDAPMGGGVQMLNATILIVDGVATITYTGIPTVASSKWATGARETSYFILSGTSFTGVKFNVSSLGMHTLYYKDSNGVEYSKQFNVETSMFNKPSIAIEIEDGFVTITPPTSPTISIKKWTKGSQDVAYFAYLGTTFTGNTFEVTEVGTYTVYVKTTSGLEYVYEFDVTEDMLPIVEINLPISAYVESAHSPSGASYRRIVFSVPLDSNIFSMSNTGYETTNGINSTSGYMTLENRQYNKITSYFPVVNMNDANRTITSEFKDSQGVTLHTMTTKITSQYFYTIVDNSYVILHRIKTNSTSVTVPIMIDGITVKDLGSLFSISGDGTGIDVFKVKTLIIPETIACATGSFAVNNSVLERVEIRNSEFKTSGLLRNSPNLIIYAPENSTIYNYLKSDTRRNVQPL